MGGPKKHANRQLKECNAKLPEAPGTLLTASRPAPEQPGTLGYRPDGEKLSPAYMFRLANLAM